VPLPNRRQRHSCITSSTAWGSPNRAPITVAASADARQGRGPVDTGGAPVGLGLSGEGDQAESMAIGIVSTVGGILQESLQTAILTLVMVWVLSNRPGERVSARPFQDQRRIPARNFANSPIFRLQKLTPDP